MKLRKMLCVCLIAAGSLVFAASAFSYYVLPYRLAKHASAEFAKEVCRTEGRCTQWNTDCQRAGPRNVVCAVATFSPSVIDGKPMTFECISITHWGIRHGYVALVHLSGKPHCGYV